jgi:transcription antitermination factor NusB
MARAEVSPPVRRLAFQGLFLLDAWGGGTEADLLKWFEENRGGFVEEIDAVGSAGGAGGAGGAELTKGQKQQAAALAAAAFAARAKADAAMAALAPQWPAHRQAAVDRAILRLGHYEILAGQTNAKLVISEAVELAKAFSTEKSPAFVNGLLDKVLKAEGTKGSRDQGSKGEGGEGLGRGGGGGGGER